MTELIRRKQPGEAWETAADGGGGGSTPGASRVLGPFPFAYDDAGLNDGIAFYTPTVGDVLFDAWISVTTAFDGTTPLADIGAFGSDVYGWYLNITNSGAPVDLTRANSVTDADLEVLLNASIRFGGNLTAVSYPSWGVPGTSRFTSAKPLKIVVSQDGYKGGAAVGGTAGAGAVYLVVATPSLT